MTRQPAGSDVPEPAAARGGAPVDDAPSSIADAAEAFLAGRYLDHTAGEHPRVRGWMAVNRLAHGDPRSLRFVADASLDGVIGWRVLEQVAARRMLALALGDADCLATIQRDVLVPLEHRLSSPHPAADRSPDDALDAALEALTAWTVRWHA